MITTGGLPGRDVLMDRWKGIHKLTEEMGEVAQVVGKINAFPDGIHPDGGKHLRDRIRDELADLEAAITYFREQNGILPDPERTRRKLLLFFGWVLTGVP